MMCKLWSGPGSFTIGPWLILSWGLACAQGLGSTEFIMEHYAMFFAHGIMFHNEFGPWLILGQGSARVCGQMLSGVTEMKTLVVYCKTK